jgi:hypothetical protein
MIPFRLLYLLLLSVCLVPSVLAQSALQQIQQTVGDRIEALTILGGDHGIGGGVYSFRGNAEADVSVTKIGAGGIVGPRRPLGIWEMHWAPVMEGNIGWASTVNDLSGGPLAGNELDFNTFAFQLGGGGRFYFTTNLSLSLSVAGIYGHTQNEFLAGNQAGIDFENSPLGQELVNWKVDTWSVVPAAGLRYTWNWHRTVFEFDSRFRYFYTESFQSTSSLIGVAGDSQTWENRLDVDVPTGWKPFGREFHTGGYFSRTDLFGDISRGMNEDYIYKMNGRAVLDFTGVLWKVRWLGVGGSYFWGRDFNGWAAGIDIRLRF